MVTTTTIPDMSPTKVMLMKTFDSIPEDLSFSWSARLYGITSLALDYADTICDICIAARFPDTKAPVRKIKSLIEEYRYFQDKTMDDDLKENEVYRGLRFEELAEETLANLLTGAREAIDPLPISSDRKRMQIAVQQAYAVTEAVRKYALEIDRLIAKRGVWVTSCTLVEGNVMEIINIIPTLIDKGISKTIPARVKATNDICDLVKLVRLVPKNKPSDEAPEPEVAQRPVSDLQEAPEVKPKAKRVRRTVKRMLEVVEYYKTHSVKETRAKYGMCPFNASRALTSAGIKHDFYTRRQAKEQLIQDVVEYCKTHRTVEAMEHFGLCRTTITTYLRKHGAKSLRLPQGLTDEQRQWIREHYSQMSNDTIAAYLGITKRQVMSFATVEHLTGTKTYVKYPKPKIV